MDTQRKNNEYPDAVRDLLEESKSHYVKGNFHKSAISLSLAYKALRNFSIRKTPFFRLSVNEFDLLNTPFVEYPKGVSVNRAMYWISIVFSAWLGYIALIDIRFLYNSDFVWLFISSLENFAGILLFAVIYAFSLAEYLAALARQLFPTEEESLASHISRCGRSYLPLLWVVSASANIVQFAS